MGALLYIHQMSTNFGSRLIKCHGIIHQLYGWIVDVSIAHDMSPKQFILCSHDKLQTNKAIKG